MDDTVARTRPTIVVESNPYVGDDQFALYPAPDGCSGHRLCCKILGMNRTDYLAAFDRRNLIQGKWSIKDARKKAMSVADSQDRMVLLGSKVCSAFDTPFVPFDVSCGGTVLIFPHPSGLCRLWNEDFGGVSAYQMARTRMKQFAPEMAHLIGLADS